MLTAYMGNVREKGFLRYFELTPSRYRVWACLDVRTRAPDVAIRPANSDRECRKELQNSNGKNRALRVVSSTTPFLASFRVRDELLTVTRPRKVEDASPK